MGTQQCTEATSQDVFELPADSSGTLSVPGYQYKFISFLLSSGTVGLIRLVPACSCECKSLARCQLTGDFIILTGWAIIHLPFFAPFLLPAYHKSKKPSPAV